MYKIILASNSKVRKKILDESEIECKVFPSNVDEESAKKSLIKENASPDKMSQKMAKKLQKLEIERVKKAKAAQKAEKNA